MTVITTLVKMVVMLLLLLTYFRFVLVACGTVCGRCCRRCCVVGGVRQTCRGATGGLGKRGDYHPPHAPAKHEGNGRRTRAKTPHGSAVYRDAHVQGRWID